MEKFTVKVPFKAGRLDAPGERTMKSPRDYKRDKRAGWNEYYAYVDDMLAEFDEFLSDFQED